MEKYHVYFFPDRASLCISIPRSSVTSTYCAAHFYKDLTR